MNELEQINKEFFIVFLFGVVIFLIGYFFGRLDMLFQFRKKCKHGNKVTRTFDVTTTCEETAIYCIDCGKQLSDFKTDCR